MLRLTKVIVPGDERIAAWAKALKEGKKVTAFDDIFLSPVTLDNVLDALTMIGKTCAAGIHQISGAKDFSYFDLARAIARHLNVDESLVERGSGAAHGVPESFRPRYSSYRMALPQAIDVPDIRGIAAYALAR